MVAAVEQLFVGRVVREAGNGARWRSRSGYHQWVPVVTANATLVLHQQTPPGTLRTHPGDADRDTTEIQYLY